MMVITSQSMLTEREKEVLRLIADGHSNREIAERLVVTVDTVKWYNRQIFEKLGVKSRTQAAALAREGGLLDSEEIRTALPVLPKHNLPASLTSFVGRRREVGEITRLVREHRLVTLTGPAGTGKTRLAVEAASRMLPTFPDGAYFVDLARITQPSQLPESTADAIGLPESAAVTITEKLKVYLSHRSLLLILDNFEHVIEAAPQISDWLSASPHLTILITSREGLRIYGEQEYLVAPLDLPNTQEGSLTANLHCESVTLFVERAKAVKADFNITDDSAPSVFEICRKLDGLPLAIELAASRVHMFSPQALAAQLEKRFTALQVGLTGLPDRQQTLRRAITWSYDLLSGKEQAMLARLSVFQGGRSVEAIKAVAGYDTPLDALEILESLVNKNLLVVAEGPENEPRFMMLETIHEYAWEKLDEMGATQELQRRHAVYFADLVQQAKMHTHGGSSQIYWLNRLELERQNIHVALAWSLEGGDVLTGLRLVGGLGDFWFRKGHYADGRMWTERALVPEIMPVAESEIHAGVLYSAGLIAFYMHDHRQAKHFFREAATMFRAFHALRDAGYSLMWLSLQNIDPNDSIAEALQIVEESRSLLESVNDQAGIAQTFNVAGELARSVGDFALAHTAYDEALRYARAIGDRLREAINVGNLGYVAQESGDAVEALKKYQEAVRLGIVLDIPIHSVWGITAIAGALTDLGYPRRAARLVGAAEFIMDRKGFTLMAPDREPYEAKQAQLRGMLSQAVYHEMWEQGQAMSIDEMLDYALANPDDNPE